jgi:tRNA nucleotidyltransferase/poly(A) polymerase
VRDHVLGLPDVVDTDYLVRGVEPGRLEEILRRHGRVVMVGKVFGVFRFTPNGSQWTYDIAFPRTEESTGPGHRAFAIQTDWMLPVEEDLQRRDFTINAVAERVPGGEIIDPFGGIADLQQRRLRTVFARAFVEDPLRVLRGARFAARFDLGVDEETRGRMREASPLLSTVSPERVQDELTKALTQCTRPSACFHLLHETGGLGVILPELERCSGVAQNEYHPDDVYWHSLKTCDAAAAYNLALRWAALMHDTGKVDARATVRDEKGERVVFYGHEVLSAELTERVLERLRYSRAFVARCRLLVREHMFNFEPQWREATLRRFMHRVGVEYLEDLFALREADCRSRQLAEELENLAVLRARTAAELAARATLRVTDLAVDGRDVMRVMGLDPGPGVGAVLERLLECVIEEPARNTREALMELMKKDRRAQTEGE